MIAASPIHEIEHLSFGLPELIPNHEVTVDPNPDQTVCTVYFRPRCQPCSTQEICYRFMHMDTS